MNATELDKVTRITVVDRMGLAYEKWDIQIEFYVQDCGRTLKVFVDDREKSAP